ncbi:MAG: ribosome biogenesis GTPase Der [Chloroflexi bacterium]|nr:ribosome biogenesis GTPase Der [Chloroflexota bacterium]
MSRPIVAIVGRQNVGKSTLLNRIVGKPVAIVEDLPGTTRDRVFADTTWRGIDFTMIDTGGLEPTPRTTVALGVQAQIEIAIQEADVIIFLVDARDGLTTPDLEIADMLRKAHRPVVVAVNKIDSARFEPQAPEFYQLGLGEPLPVSAVHGRGVAELLDKVVALLPPAMPSETELPVMKVAIVGRPNVGKSTLLNALLGKERVIVDEKPGTTRDAIDVLLDFRGRNVLLIDTAGIRRRGRIEAGVEKYSVLRALRAIDRADVVLLLVDATELVAAQDTHIAGYIREAAKGVVIIVNKWDLVKEKNIQAYTDYLRKEFNFIAYAPVLYVSAKLGRGTDSIMPEAEHVYQERLKRPPKEEVTSVIQQAMVAHVLPRSGKKQLKVFSVFQSAVNPPTFVFSVNDAKLIHFSYRRYLENRLRAAFGFAGTPIPLVFKSRGEA